MEEKRGSVAVPALELSVETLAISFSKRIHAKTSPKPTLQQDKKSSGRNKGGKSLFRKFIRENARSQVSPSLSKSILTIRFGGFLQDPPTLLLQGTSEQLQKVRKAWTRRLLRPPDGYDIEFVGDVTRIAARPLEQENPMSLEHAICTAIRHVSSVGDVATQSTIANQLARNASGESSCHGQLLHETLGTLIRKRKVFCTGPGYHLVTKTTYSGRLERNRNDSANCDCPKESNYCQNCLAEVTRNLEDMRLHRYHADFSGDPTHCTANSLPSNMSVTLPNYSEQTTKQKSKRTSRVRRSKSLDSEKRTKLSRLADKLFLRRHRSSSMTKCKETDSLRGTSKNHCQANIRHLSEDEAIRLGYQHHSSMLDGVSPTDHYQRKPQATRSPSTHCQHCRCGSTETNCEQGIPRYRPNSAIPIDCHPTHSLLHMVPDVIPEKHRRKRTQLPESTSGTLTDVPPVSSHTPKKMFERQWKDVGITCNLENPPDSSCADDDRLSASRQKYASICIQPSQYVPKKPLKRTESLRLPGEKRTVNYAHYPFQSPVHKTGYSYESPTRNGYSTPDELDSRSNRNSLAGRRTRKSMSNLPSERACLHVYHPAPCVRIGSVIAGHLEELERRRKYYSLQSVDERLERSEVSRDLSFESNKEEINDNLTERCISVDRDSVSQSDISGSADRGKDEMDPETKAALEVAKRLAELDIKMTREEWKEYFSYKTLPKSVEEVLRQNNNEKQEPSMRLERQTYFEKTSGSVETVIDARQFNAPPSSRNSLSSQITCPSDLSSTRFEVANLCSSRPTTSTNQKEFDATSSWRSSRVSSVQKRTHQDISPVERVTRSLSRQSDVTEYDEMYIDGQDQLAAYGQSGVEDGLMRDDMSDEVFRNCDRGQTRLSLCDHHSRALYHCEKTSTTEYSDYHSPRIDQGTFV